MLARQILGNRDEKVPTIQIMFPWLKLAVVGIGIAAALLALHILFIWMDRKGWMYYRKPRPKDSYSGTRGVLSTFQEIVQPEIRQVKEDRDHRLSVSRPEDPSDR